MLLNTRTSHITPAPIIQLLSEVSMSDDVLSLGQGIPFFGPPFESIKALQQISSKREGYSYSPDEGVLLLQTKIKEKILRENGFRVDEKQIIITAGANQGFMNIILSITHPGDEIIIITPSYFNYVMAVHLAGCIPVFVPSNQNTYLPGIEEIENKITRRTKAIITVSPNNPTGVVYPKWLLKNINALCKENGLFHISDEVYEYYVYDDHVHVSPGLFDKNLTHTISLFSCSKSFGMSGYRIGCIIAPQFLIQDIIKVQDTIGICAPVPCQYAAIYAYELGRSYIKKFLSEINEIRDLFFKILRDIDGIQCQISQGAMYFFIRFLKDVDTWNLAKTLIERYKIITIPGSVFNVSYPSIRISFGNLRMKESQKAIKRLQTGIHDLL